MSGILSDRDRDAYEILLRGALRDVVRAQARHAAEQNDASEAALAVAARNARTIDKAADAVGITPDALSLRAEDQASVYVTRETVVALRELAAAQGETPADRAGVLNIQLIPEGTLGNIMGVLLNNEVRDFGPELRSLDTREKANLRPAIRILLLGADRDLARAQLAVAQEVPGASTQQAQRDFVAIANCAHVLGIDPKEIVPETPAEVHVTREKVVALRELRELRPGSATLSPVPVPSQGPLGDIFTAMQNQEAPLPTLHWHEDSTILRAQAEMLILGARRDAIKAEVEGDEGVKARADRDDALMTKLAKDIGILPELNEDVARTPEMGNALTRIKPDTAGKAHVTRELIAASQNLPPERQDETIRSLNTNGRLNLVFQRLIKGDTPGAGTGRSAARG